jgi:hypothetical protein
MAFWDDVAEGNLGTALVVGIGAAVLLPLARDVLRPAAKMAIKSGLVIYDQATRLTEGARAEMSNIAREVRAEHEARSSSTRPGPHPTSSEAGKGSGAKPTTA